jgi:hypothetical protein
MIHFPPLRTKRLNVQMRELTIQQAIDLAATPPKKHETATQALLKFVVEESAGPAENPLAWTVEERMMAVAYYLSCVSEDSADFSVGDAKFTDFLLTGRDTAPDAVEAGWACGSDWHLHQVNGAQALAMEAVCASRWDWVVADMAVRMRPADETSPPPDAIKDPESFGEWLTARMQDVRHLPESEFSELFVLMNMAADKARHLFHVEVDAEGYFALAGKGGDQPVAARFPVSAAILDLTRSFCDQPPEQRAEPEPALRNPAAAGPRDAHERGQGNP